ncbi:MAG: hypothetical protein GKR89_18440 [Candidatus Latescibacteria bacterium]|nr:hypothetical protein [Candidatus Latescibacterota bacterium]
MKISFLLVVVALAGWACSDLTTSTDMVFDSDPAEPVTFAAIQDNIFTPSCALSGCHGADNFSNSPNLATGQAYANIVGVASLGDLQAPRRPLIAAGDPDNSYLYLKLLDGAAVEGVRMPNGGPYLPADTIAMVRAWIEAGALND